MRAVTHDPQGIGPQHRDIDWQFAKIRHWTPLFNRSTRWPARRRGTAVALAEEAVTRFQESTREKQNADHFECRSQNGTLAPLESCIRSSGPVLIRAKCLSAPVLRNRVDKQRLLRKLLHPTTTRTALRQAAATTRRGRTTNGKLGRAGDVGGWNAKLFGEFLATARWTFGSFIASNENFKV